MAFKTMRMSVVRASPAGFGRRDESFDNMPLSVGEVARVELVAHTHMLPQPTETF